jgi:hypothetical protein
MLIEGRIETPTDFDRVCDVLGINRLNVLQRIRYRLRKRGIKKGFKDFFKQQDELLEDENIPKIFQKNT